eukprot:SAG31_NODE_2916_length_4915_cov_43.966985_1_plen_70_part_10
MRRNRDAYCRTAAAAQRDLEESLASLAALDFSKYDNTVQLPSYFKIPRSPKLPRYFGINFRRGSKFFPPG